MIYNKVWMFTLLYSYTDGTATDGSDSLQVSTYIGDFYQGTGATEPVWHYPPLSLFPHVLYNFNQFVTHM
jgi:hypothetical protein